MKKARLYVIEFRSAKSRRKGEKWRPTNAVFLTQKEARVGMPTYSHMWEADGYETRLVVYERSKP